MIVVQEGKFPLLLHVSGEELWALLMLVAAGRSGAPVFGPNPRLNRGVQRLRRRGLRVATTRRRGHGQGQHRRHRRFVLASNVKFVGGPRGRNGVRHRPT
jgi:hypothetical protein